MNGVRRGYSLFSTRGLAAFVVLCVVLYPALTTAQIAGLAERQRFLEDLSRMLLGTQGTPMALGPGKGWRGVLFAPPGTASASLMTPFDVLGNDTLSVSKLLENVNTFDRALFVNSGIANQGPVPLAEVWKRVLERSRPDFSSASDSTESAADVAILFRKADKIDQARGVVYRREPSEAMLRYREYELLFRSLSTTDASNSGMWRLNPQLSKYVSLSEAKAAVAEDWITYGYKREIDAARARLVDNSSSKAWMEWSSAQAAFSNARNFIGPENWVALTILFPPPSEWLGMGTWLRGSSATSDPNVRVTYQIARIKIIRPWLSLEQLLDGRLRLRRPIKGEEPFILSDGATPSVVDYPNGAMAVLGEELILVRDIRFIVKDSQPEQRVAPHMDHPLGLFAYPDQINLLGYVVRALPKVVN